MWQSNALRAADARSDLMFVARPRFKLMSDWSRHALEVSIGAAPTWHNRFASEDDRAWTVDARGRIDLTRTSVLEGGFAHEVTQESRSSLNAALIGSSRADVITDRVTAAAGTRFGRFGVQAKGTLEETTYGGGTGGAGSDAARDRLRSEQGLRLSYFLRPTLAAFTEVSLNQRDFAGIAAGDGISRDSSGERYRAGVSFGSASGILRGEVSAGWGRQSGRDERLGAVSGLLFDANLGWRATALTSFLLSASTDFQDTLLANVLAGSSRTVKLEARHAFSRALIGAADVGVAFTDYDGGLAERETVGGAQIEYYLSREMMSFARWQHTTLTSTQAGRGYAADEIGFGVRLSR